jgi:hypothetical protein
MTRGELIEKMARALDPDVWDDPIPCPTRADVVSFHSRRQASCAQADRALTTLEEAIPGLSGLLDGTHVVVVAKQAASLCDCELSHNGLGMAGRGCDCPAGHAMIAAQETPRE